MTELRYTSVPTGTKTPWRSERITGQEGVWRVADEIFMNGGDIHLHSDQQMSRWPYPKGKPPKLLQQSGGPLRFGKHSPICVQFIRETSETQEQFFSALENDRRY